MWIGGDVSQETLWGEYAAGYLNHKASVHVSFEADIGVNSLSVLAGTLPPHHLPRATLASCRGSCCVCLSPRACRTLLFSHHFLSRNATN